MAFEVTVYRIGTPGVRGDDEFVGLLLNGSQRPAFSKRTILRTGEFISEGERLYPYAGGTINDTLTEMEAFTEEDPDIAAGWVPRDGFSVVYLDDSGSARRFTEHFGLKPHVYEVQFGLTNRPTVASAGNKIGFLQ